MHDVHQLSEYEEIYEDEDYSMYPYQDVKKPRYENMETAEGFV